MSNLPGDFNEDNIIGTGADLVYLLSNLTDLSNNYNYNNDLTKNNSITTKDVDYLANHVAGTQGYELPKGGIFTRSHALGNIAIGHGAIVDISAVDVSTENSIAIGNGASAIYNNSIAIGKDVSTTATNQIVLGDSSHNLVINGNVGIGTNTPDASSILHVEGNALRVCTANILDVQDTSPTHTEGLIKLGLNNYGPQIHCIRNKDGWTDNTDLQFWTSGQNIEAYHAMTIKGNQHHGRVGIGTTTPAGKLHISSGTDGKCKLILESDTDNSNESDQGQILFRQDGGLDLNAVFVSNTVDDAYANYLNLASSNATPAIVFRVDTGNDAINATERMRIDSNGNVGIGTDDPTSALHISKSLSLDTDNSSMINFENTQSGYWDWSIGPTIRNSNNAAFCIRGGGSGFSNINDLVTIYGNGNVGIGTTPTTELDVNGHGWCRTLCVGSYGSFSNINGGDSAKLQISNSVWNGAITIEFSGRTNGHRGDNQALGKIMCKSNDSDNYENHYITFKVAGWGFGVAPHHNPLNERFWFYGNGEAKATEWEATSDDRVKHNEKSITNAMDIINKLNGKLYFKSNDIKEYNYDYELDNSGNPITDEYYRLEAGFIAQELREIPELEFCVSGKEYVDDFDNCFKKDASGNTILDENNNPILIPEHLGTIPNLLSVSYNDIFVYNVVATQELCKENEILKTKVATLESQVATLHSKFNDLLNKFNILETKIQNN